MCHFNIHLNTRQSSLLHMAGSCVIQISSHAADVSRRHAQDFTKFTKIVKVLEFHDYIWNLHEKCIKISTNMPGIGL